MEIAVSGDDAEVYELSCNMAARHGAHPVDGTGVLAKALRRGGTLPDHPDAVWRDAAPTPSDFVPTVDVVRLVSSRVKEVFNAHLGPADTIDWIPATLISNEQRLPYWVPHFPNHVDLLDKERSGIGPLGVPATPVYSASKLAGHAVTVYALPPRAVQVSGETLHAPSSLASLIYVVTAPVRQALLDENVTGAVFIPRPVI